MRNGRIPVVGFAALVMSLLLAASVVGVQGKAAPWGTGTITVGNGIYGVSVEDAASSAGIGTYTVSTGSVFPQPNENVLYGGVDHDPLSSYLTVRSYTSGTDYVTTTDAPESTFTVRNLDPALVSLNWTNTAVTVTWNTTALNSSDALLISQVTAVEGMNLFNSRVRVTTNVTNAGSAPVSIGIRYEWDLMIDGNDGSWFAEPEGEWLDAENEWLAPSFESFETTDDPETPFFSIFGTVTGPETFEPLPTPPDLLQFANWSGAFYTTFDYTPTGQIVAGNDSAVTYLWGHNETTAIELGVGETKSVTQYLYVVVVDVTQDCEDWFESFEDEFGLDICVYTYGDQSIVITDGTKTVEILLRGHDFDCDEIWELLNGLDLANFATLPEVMLIEFEDDTGSVDFLLWLSRADYLAELDPTLHVENLQLITGTGSFARFEMSCTASGYGDVYEFITDQRIFVGDFSEECDDERLIFGITELAKMVQRYGAQPMDYEWIRINPETDSVEVRYTTDATTLLLVNLSAEIVDSTGLFGQQIAAVDAVVAFGSPSVWAGENNPPFSVIRLVNDSGNLAVAFGEADQLLLTFDQSLIFSTLPAGKAGAIWEAAGGQYWWSEPAFKRVRFANDSGNLSVIFGDANLTVTYDEDLIFNSLPDRTFGEFLEGEGGHYWWSTPAFNEVDVHNDTANGTLVVTFGTDGAINLTVTYDGSLIFNSFTEGATRSTHEASGGHYWWSTPAFNEVHFHNDTANGTLVVTFGTDGAINLTLIYDGSLIFNTLSASNLRSTLEGSGGQYWWSTPAFNEVHFHNDTANGTLTVYVGNRSSPFVPQLVIQYCAELFEGEYPVTLRRTLEWLCDNERFATLLARFDQVIIECLGEEGARVTLLLDNQEQASRTFDLRGVTDPEFAERVIAFFSESLNPLAKVPALNLLGLLSLMGLLSLVAVRRLRR